MKRRWIKYNPDFNVIEKQCADCRICEMVCSLENTGKCNPAKSRIQIINFLPDKGVPEAYPVVCQQCAKPLCRDACPVDAVSLDDQLGIVVVDEEACIGCGDCVDACPFGGMSLDPHSGTAIKCTLCGGDPKCVRYCPSGVLRLVENKSFVIQKKQNAAVNSYKILKMKTEALSKLERRIESGC